MKKLLQTEVSKRMKSQNPSRRNEKEGDFSNARIYHSSEASREVKLTLGALSEIISALSGEWEITVKLPDSEVIRLTGSEDFLC